MTQLTLGVDRDSGGAIAATFDERDDAVKAMLAMAIEACRKAGKYVGICGQGPSDHPDLAQWLVDAGHREHVAQSGHGRRDLAALARHAAADVALARARSAERPMARRRAVGVVQCAHAPCRPSVRRRARAARAAACGRRRRTLAHARVCCSRCRCRDGCCASSLRRLVVGVGCVRGRGVAQAALAACRAAPRRRSRARRAPTVDGRARRRPRAPRDLRRRAAHDASSGGRDGARWRRARSLVLPDMLPRGRLPRACACCCATRAAAMTAGRAARARPERRSSAPLSALVCPARRCR